MLILMRPPCNPRISSLAAPGLTLTRRRHDPGSIFSRNCMQVLWIKKNVRLSPTVSVQSFYKKQSAEQTTPTKLDPLENHDFWRNVSLDSASSRCRCSSSWDSRSFRWDSIMDLSFISKCARCFFNSEMSS